MTAQSDEAFMGKLAKAKFVLMANSSMAFFSTLVLQLRHVINNDIPTARVDGKVIEYNSEWAGKFSVPELVGLLLHEVMHVAFVHMFRVPYNIEHPKPNEIKRWQHATDYAINQLIVGANFKLPPGGLLNDKFKGMSAEQIYHLLDDKDLGEDFDEVVVAGSDGAGNKKENAPTEQEIRDMVLQAAEIAKATNGESYGNVPAEIKRYIDELSSPKVNWKAVLRRFLRSHIKQKINWRKPNKRYFPKHLLPSKKSKGLKRGTVFIDTSGSISKDELTAFISEVASMLDMPEIASVDVYQFGCNIVGQCQTITTREHAMNFQYVGGGGTSMRWLKDWVEENTPPFVVVFTDGYFSKIEDVGVPVIWVIKGADQFEGADFGTVIFYEGKDK